MSDTQERVISARRRPEDHVDSALRPQTLAELLGQERVKENLGILIDAAKARDEALDHVLLYGPPGLGKCITGESLVLTEHGLIALRQLIPPALSPGDHAACRVRVCGRDGLEPATHVYASGRGPTIRVRTRSGFELEGTPDHPVLVATPTGPQWRPLKELTGDSYVAVARGMQVWGQPLPITFQPTMLDNTSRKQNTDQRVAAVHSALMTALDRAPTGAELEWAYSGTNKRNPAPRDASRRLGLPLTDGRKLQTQPMPERPHILTEPVTWQVPQVLDADLAYLMGLLIGDGHFEQGAAAPACDITATEPEIQEAVIRIYADKFGNTPTLRRYANRAPRIRFSQNFGHFMIQLGVRPVLAGQKEVPFSILSGPAAVARGFLQGVFDADGHAWRKEGYVDWSSKAEVLARQVQVLLSNFGVIAHQTARTVRGQTYWQLFIGGQDAALFYERVGFRLSRKQARQAQLQSTARGANRSDCIPFAQVALAQLFNAFRPHPRALHKTFYHVLRGDRLLSRSQVARYLHLLPESAGALPAASVLAALCNPHYFWDRVASLQPGEAETFDLCVPGTHSFVANGIICHNTTLAHVIAHEMDVSIKITAGPVIERAGDLAAILTNLREGDILFIDEVHRLGRAVEEVLYPAMEDYALDIVIGKGPSARSIRLKLPRFTVVGATTRLALLTAPLRARFGATYRLEFYELEAMQAIVRRGSGLLSVEIDEAGIAEIARRARGTPRVALRLLKRVRDYAQVRADGLITEAVAREALSLLDVDELGLDEVDRRVLRTIIEKFGGGPVGLETIAASISEEADTIMDVYEPYLLQLGFLDRTPRGRGATRLAYEHLGLTYEEPSQPKLL